MSEIPTSACAVCSDFHMEIQIRSAVNAITRVQIVLQYYLHKIATLICDFKS